MYRRGVCRYERGRRLRRKCPLPPSHIAIRRPSREVPDPSVAPRRAHFGREQAATATFARVVRYLYAHRHTANNTALLCHMARRRKTCRMYRRMLRRARGITILLLYAINCIHMDTRRTEMAAEVVRTTGSHA